MKSKLTNVVAAAGLLAAAFPIYAHHSFSAEFDSNKQVRLEGKVVGNSIEADTESPWCQYHLTLKRE